MRKRKLNGEIKGVYVKRPKKRVKTKTDTFHDELIWAKIREWKESIAEQEEIELNDMTLREFCTEYRA